MWMYTVQYLHPLLSSPLLSSPLFREGDICISLRTKVSFEIWYVKYIINMYPSPLRCDGYGWLTRITILHNIWQNLKRRKITCALLFSFSWFSAVILNSDFEDHHCYVYSYVKRSASMLSFLFYSILFYSILFCSILFYFVLFCYIIWHVLSHQTISHCEFSYDRIRYNTMQYDIDTKTIFPPAPSCSLSMQRTRWPYTTRYELLFLTIFSDLLIDAMRCLFMPCASSNDSVCLLGCVCVWPVSSFILFLYTYLYFTHSFPYPPLSLSLSPSLLHPTLSSFLPPSYPPSLSPFPPSLPGDEDGHWQGRDQVLSFLRPLFLPLQRSLFPRPGETK